MNILKNKTILISGGTGSFGRKFTEIVLKEFTPKKLIIYSRDEYKQHEMQQQFAKYDDILRFFIGDVRDKDRLKLALDKVDYLIHAAALKQVPAMEYNPSEAVKTNVIGAMNIIDACIEKKIEKAISLSTDKACNPINLYGATKLCADKLFVAANSYSGAGGTKFSVVRYGNVVASRGSVIPAFKKMREKGTIHITHPNMTRFWITLDYAVRFVIKSLSRMIGGEIFVPKIPSMYITDLAKAIAPNCKIKFTGIRAGEKMHESMISEDDSRFTREFKDYYIINPSIHPWWNDTNHSSGKGVPEDFRYNSKTNKEWLDIDEFKKLLNEKGVKSSF